MAWAADPVDLVALLRSNRRWWTQKLGAAGDGGDVEAMLHTEFGLFAQTARARARAEIDAWRERGIAALSIHSPAYPPNLRAGSNPPPLLFVRGELIREDRGAVAVVGTRRPSDRGLRAAWAVAETLVDAGFTVVSGLATGIDVEAHTATLAAGGRTLGVVGCGLDHCYPPQSATLQRRIEADAAVLSQFWPEVRPSRRTFPMRNGLMAALTLATVIVEAGPTSGTRVQARQALDCARRVLLLPAVMDQPWAHELAARPGVTVVRAPSEVSEALADLAPAQTVP